ncbi:MAG: HAMP domain-containing sensor histidine kinase [Spirochaetales bacterium]
MKRLSAKLKLTLWCSLLMLLLAGIVMALILSFWDNIITTNSKSSLMKVVNENGSELEFDKRELEIDDVDFFKDGVYTILYSENGERIAGNLPATFDAEPPLLNKTITEITENNTKYYLYDWLAPVENSDKPIWVRGVISIDESAGAINSILQAVLFFLPFFVIFATVGCYFIAKHTFRPIDKIIKTAEKISCDENLSLRINLKKGSKEIYKLARTFDKMFKRLETAFESEKQFSQNVSHELRTPTAVILAHCEYALNSNASIEDKQEALEVVQKQAMKMSKLISDLLGLIRLERGIEKPEFIPIDLSELVTIVCEEKAVIALNNITLDQTIMPNIMLNANQTMMIRLVTNLVSNAFRYGKENGTVKVSLTENDHEIILTVEDDGIGIAPEHKEKIWQRFYQIDSARTAEKSESMGLGLSMVRQIAKIHNAKINLVSEVNKGSCFTVQFPK